MVKMSLPDYLISYKLIFFESLIIFLEHTIKLIQIIWFAKVTIILIMMAQVLFFDIIFEKDPHLNDVEYDL